jgi:3,4-dihydroxy 2-butanone 4-phosphate synthase
MTIEEFGKSPVVRVKRAIELLRQGEGILLVDDDDRENEGDLVFSAEHISVPAMVKLIRYCSGIVCLVLTEDHILKLGLPMMVEHNSSRYGTAFTVSIEAKVGVTTGVSAHDRVKTIQTALADDARPEDLARPGHVFPLKASNGGVLQRRGHTEGSIDLMKLAGLKPAAVLCELANDDGTMARLPEICSFAMANGMSVVSVEDIVHSRINLHDFSRE